MTLAIGDQAPDFELVDGDGRTHRLSDYRGRWVVVYFYPRDDTPGCTAEACSFRDHFPAYGQREVTVLGISTDDPESHRRFAAKYGLPFPLLADTDHAVAERYGVWRERERDGKRFWLTHRATFLIDPEGRIARIWDPVMPADHAAEVLSALPA